MLDGTIVLGSVGAMVLAAAALVVGELVGGIVPGIVRTGGTQYRSD